MSKLYTKDVKRIMQDMVTDGEELGEIVTAYDNKTSLSANDTFAVIDATSGEMQDIAYSVLLTELDADLTQIGPKIKAATAKTTPIDADLLVISDSADSDKTKKVTIAEMKAILKTYFDTLYQAKV